MNRKETDLNRVIASQDNMLQRVLGEGISLQLHCSAQPAVVAVDEAMMGQILISLAENARRAMPGGGTFTLQTELWEVDDFYAQTQPGARPGHYVRLSISDNGCGIGADQLPGLFQTPVAGAVRNGAGLGLPIIVGIIQRQHGWIETASQAGAGTTFKIFLPQFGATATTSPQKETVLVVDDELVIRGMVRNVLQRASYEVVEADTGSHALSIWEQHKAQVDLLLTDMVMPDGIDGRELAQRLKSTKPGLKVIYTSGFNLNEPAKSGRASDGIRFLHKPYDLRTLLETVQSTLTEPALESSACPT
jgi:CheY-like chemotaxis protein